MQTKLEVSKPADFYEQEADRVADRVMRTAEPTAQRACATCASGDSSCPTCEAEEGPMVQRHAEAQSGHAASSVDDGFLAGLGTGQPLEPATRAFMEPRFGHNFSQVRIHTDEKAAESANAVNALAYTVGDNVVFGAGQFAQETLTGRNLLAHELTHVVQQAGNRGIVMRQQACPPDPCHHVTSGVTQREIHLNLSMRAVRVYRRGAPYTIAAEYQNLIVGPSTYALARANDWCHLYPIQGHQPTSGHGLLNFVNYCGGFGFHSNYWRQDGEVERIPGEQSQGCARIPDSDRVVRAESQAFYDLVQDGDCVRLYAQPGCWRDPTFSQCSSGATCSLRRPHRQRTRT